MAKKHRTGHLYQRGNVYWLKYTVDGRTVRQSLETSDAEAAETKQKEIMRPFVTADRVDVLAMVSARLADEQTQIDAKVEAEFEAAHPPLTIALAWDAFDRSPRKPDSGDRTLSGYKSHFKRFSKWITREHPDVIALRDVTAAHASEYAQHLTGEKVTPSTFNQHIGLLRLAWKILANEARTGGANPWGYSPKDGIARKKTQSLVNRKRALTSAQFTAVLAAASADPDLKDLFSVLAWTGQRLVDGLKLRWEAVDFHERVITLYPQKTARRTGKEVHIPIFPTLLAVLNRRHAAMPHTTASAWVFPQLVEEYDRDAGSAIAKRIQAVFEKAGLTTSEVRPGLARVVVLYGAHSFRHLFVTAAAAAGLPAARIKAITGHSSDAMSEHYQHFEAGLASEFAKRLTGKAAKRAPAPDAAFRKQVRALAKGMTADTWEKAKKELLKLAKVV